MATLKPPSSPSYYPYVSFHFRVNFIKPIASKKELEFGKDIDLFFQSVSGLDVQMETESIKEGGENRFEHVVPQRSKYADLVLKRGVITSEESDVSKWCIEAFKNHKVKPANLLVELLNENHEPLIKWNVFHAWPKNWKLSELNAEKGEIFIETLELNYNWFDYSK